MERISDSNAITRQYLDSLLIETRYLDAVNPTTGFELYGKRFATPITTAALSHLNHFMFEGAMDALVQGAKDANAVCMIGMTEDAELEHLAGIGAEMIEIIKPYKDRDLIYKKIERDEKLGFLAVGIDIDHPFNEDGSPDIVDGHEMAAITTAELTQICKATKLPVITKGVLSVRDAVKSADAGVKGILLSHHNNRINYAVPPLMMIEEIKKAVNHRVDIFVDDEITTGLDAFKALALGAKAVSIGRPLMTAIKKDGSCGVQEYIKKANDQLAKAMAYTGCGNLDQLDPAIIHKKCF